MNIHNLVVHIPKPPFFKDFKPLPKQVDGFWEEFDDAFTPCNTPTTYKHCKKKRKTCEKHDGFCFYPFDNLDDFLKFYSEM